MTQPPHGGALVDLLVTGRRRRELAIAAHSLPGWDLTRRQLCDLELLANGGFSPLRGFLGREDYESVCTSMRLTSGELWPIPVVLDVPDEVAEAARAAGGLALRARGRQLAVMWPDEVWRPDREEEAATVLGTTDAAHPGVQALRHQTHPWYLGGRLEVLEPPTHHAFRAHRLTPSEVRSAIRERGWQRVVAFQTRNPMHRAHQELTLRAAREVDANLLLQPVVGITKPGDVDPAVRVRCYRALLPTYPPGSVLLSLLPLAMRMAGPREALWHAIIRKNFGATHFIVGRDHAGPGPGSSGTPYYAPYAAQELVREHEDELGIGVVPFRQMVYVQEVRGYVPEDQVQPGQHCLRISGTEQRRRLARGDVLPAWFTPPEVAVELRRAFPGPSARGAAVLLGADLCEPAETASALAAWLREAGRTVTLLGDDGPDEGWPVLLRLVGDVVRNGGTVVSWGATARRLVAEAAELARRGLVLDVAEPRPRPGQEPGERDGDDVIRVAAPPAATPADVAQLVWDTFRRLGHVASDPGGGEARPGPDADGDAAA